MTPPAAWLVSAGLLLGLADAPWTGESGGFQVTVSQSDVSATSGAGPQAATVFSLLARQRARLPQLEQDAREWAADMLDTHHLEPPIEASSGSLYQPLSLVGPYLSLEASHYGDWPGAAHPSAVSMFETFDLRAPDEPPNLARLFPESDILKALLGDRVVREQLAESASPKPPSLAALVEALAGAGTSCEYSFDSELLSHFAFHDVVGERVAVRLGLSHGCEAARGNLTQLGLLLPIPPALKADFERARDGSGGFLMKAAAQRFKTLGLRFDWSKDLTPLIEAERRRRRAPD